MYYLSMEGCVSNWVENTVGDYISTAGYHIVLGEQQEGKSVSSTHCFYRVGRKAVTNSFQTQVRRYQKLHWGVYLQANSLIADHDPPNERFQIIDIGDFLHQNVKSQMHRKDSTRFKIGFQNGEKPDAKTLLDERVAELLCWAEENGFDQAGVKAALRRRVEAESNNDGEGTMTRPAVAEIVGERKSPPETLGDSIPQQSNIPGTSMAPRRKKNAQTTPSSKSNTGGSYRCHIGRRCERRRAWEKTRRI